MSIEILTFIQTFIQRCFKDGTELEARKKTSCEACLRKSKISNAVTAGAPVYAVLFEYAQKALKNIGKE